MQKVAQTHERNTTYDSRTQGHCDLQTELSQRANSAKISVCDRNESLKEKKN